MPKYTVRPFSKPARADLKDAFRIYVSPATLLRHKLNAGDLCLLWKETSQKYPAIAWPAPEHLQDTVVQTSRTLQSAYHFVLGDKVSLAKSDDEVHAIDKVYLKEILPGENRDGAVQAEADRREDEHWEWFLEEPLERAEFLAVGMIFDGIARKDRRRSFRIERIIDRNGDLQMLARFQTTSKLEISSADLTEDTSPASLILSNADIGGLTPQIQLINRVLTAFNSINILHSWIVRPGGLLLHGSAGTGKSMLLQRIARTGWGKVFNLDASTIGRHVGDTTMNIHKIFEAARSQPRSIIIIDQLDLFASKERQDHGGLSSAGTLRSELKALNDVELRGQVIVVAATSRINDIDNSLRRPDCFEFEIEIPIPNANARTEIIKTIAGLSLSTADALLESLGERTHGYTGSDLYALMRMAGWECVYRQRARAEGDDDDDDGGLANGSCDVDPNEGGMAASKNHSLIQDDVDKALLQIRPTAMREIFLEVPKVRWSDIGGQEHVKQSLREALEWQLKNPARMQRLGIQPKKGLLLYGPPGCSKTLTAKALATESGLNFIAVKGAELLNMYVGESERALREVFSKARAASPSIIFFDEIDAIASRRDHSSSSGGQPAGLNVLTTLLNEMDGIESLKGVTVLAATNKPEVLDLALLRPGRLDTLLYVGLPDLAARTEILRIKLSTMHLAPDVDVPTLAQATDGYTGAEIVSLCDTAGYRAFADSDATGLELPIAPAHFEHALTVVHRQITSDVREAYESWAGGAGKRGTC